MPDTKHILKVLRDELLLQTRHCKLLEAQEQALLACDRDRFTALQLEYARMLLELETQDAARRAALTDEQGNSLSFTGLKKLIPALSLTTLEDGLRRVMERIHILTQRNKTLIQNELDYFAFTLDLFVEAGRSAQTGYGGSGRLMGRLMLDRRA